WLYSTLYRTFKTYRQALEPNAPQELLGTFSAQFVAVHGDTLFAVSGQSIERFRAGTISDTWFQDDASIERAATDGRFVYWSTPGLSWGRRPGGIYRRRLKLYW